MILTSLCIIHITWLIFLCLMSWEGPSTEPKEKFWPLSHLLRRQADDHFYFWFHFLASFRMDQFSSFWFVFFLDFNAWYLTCMSCCCFFSGCVPHAFQNLSLVVCVVYNVVCVFFLNFWAIFFIFCILLKFLQSRCRMLENKQMQKKNGGGR